VSNAESATFHRVGEDKDKRKPESSADTRWRQDIPAGTPKHQERRHRSRRAREGGALSSSGIAPCIKYLGLVPYRSRGLLIGAGRFYSFLRCVFSPVDLAQPVQLQTACLTLSAN
jgi:hypothetical protein